LAAEPVGAGDLAAWRPLFTALLRNQTPPLQHRAPARAFDRLARLSGWLSDDTAAAGPGLVDDLDRLTYAELVWLLLAADPDVTAWRLRRVLANLPDQRREALIDRLAPGLLAPAGLVASALVEAAQAARLPILARALAAALAGADLKPADLTAPILAPPATRRPAAGIGAGDVDAGRVTAWLAGADVPVADADGLVARFNALLDAGDLRLTIFLKARLADAGLRARWARLLPPSAFERLLAVFAPSHAAAALQAALLIETAARRTARFGAPRVDAARLRALLLEAAASGRAPTLDQLVARLIDETVQDAAGAEALRGQAIALARDGGHLAAVAALRQAAVAPKPPAPQKPKPEFAKPQAAKPVPDETPPAEPDHALFVDNAGLVLFNPYLPRLFERLGVLTIGEEGRPRIEGLEASSRAVHLLQYLVDSRLDAPEPELALNKLLCGLPTATPVEPSVAASEADLALCDELLTVVIANWPILRNSSVDALRETFLRREGRLLHKDDRWTLQVQRKTVDVLVDQVPWTFSMIYHRWMSTPLHVIW